MKCSICKKKLEVGDNAKIICYDCLDVNANNFAKLEAKLAESERSKEINIKERDKICIEMSVDYNKQIYQLKQQLAEERKKVVGELKVDIRSLFDAYASSLLDYCIWSINAYTHKKLYNNFKRVIKNRLDKVLDLFDKRIDRIERGEDV